MTRIRPATPEDVPALRSIQTATLAEPWPDLLESAVQGPLLVLVAQTDRPVGYAIVVTGESRAYVPELAVAPDHQREGHGSALLAALCERLTGEHETVRLTARESDEGALDFYREQGFSVVDRVTDHFENGDGLVLERSLEG
jgi:ribosomal-protein-alanine N-acetyltransferase